MIPDTINIVEAALHHEVVDSLIRMCLDSNIQVRCFCSNECRSYSDFKSDTQIEWKHLAEIGILHKEKNALIFISTLDKILSRHHQLFKQHKTAAYIHNLNNFTQNKSEAIPGLKTLYLKLRNFKKRKAIKKLMTAVDLQLIPHRGFKSKASEYLSFVYPAKRRPKVESKKLSFGLPGVINTDRRDYDALFLALDKIDDRLTKKVCCKFIGKLFTPDIENKIQAARKNLKNIEIEYFNSYLDQESFWQEMQACAFLVLPIKKRIKYESYYEERGKTCVSGNINDMLRFGLPSILPEFYPLEGPITEMTSRYNNQKELEEKLLDWIENKSYLQINKKLDSILNAYKNEQLESFRKVIERLNQI